MRITIYIRYKFTSESICSLMMNVSATPLAPHGDGRCVLGRNVFCLNVGYLKLWEELSITC